MQVTIDVNDTELKALRNACAVYGFEAHSLFFGCESRLGDKLKEKYPEKDFAEIADMVVEQAVALKELVLFIEKECKEE